MVVLVDESWREERPRVGVEVKVKRGARCELR